MLPVFLTTLSIEAVQLSATYLHGLYTRNNYNRGFDIDDILLNTFGAVLGYLVLIMVKKSGLLKQTGN